MARHLVVAQFHDYGAAHRALCELIQAGLPSNRISIVAGDRSNSSGANRDFGLLETDAEFYLAAVRRGTTLLAVQAKGADRVRAVEIVESHAPIDLANDDADWEGTTWGSPAALASPISGRARRRCRAR
ncbi:MAG TPA: hypothetical protein VGS13_03535 [Stellaceae bacterium]|nr:hypothetical protein [Stellaceae bacterium]